MRPITETLLYDDAMKLVMAAATPIARTERVALVEAGGRVVAADVVASIDVPPFDRAAMDGYAVVAEDTFGAGTHAPKTLRCVGSALVNASRLRPVLRCRRAPMPW
jgi:molybdopterin molybdotransferase